MSVVPVADLITHRLPLEQTIEGIHTVTRGGWPSRSRSRPEGDERYSTGVT
jgi:hypothetical protein